MSSYKPVVEVKNLTVGYGENNIILENLNFEVHDGEIFIIMGTSGSGKTTLLKHLIGLYDPVEGEINVYGKSMIRKNLEDKKDIIKYFGVTYQDGALFSALTLGENISLLLDEFTDLSKEDKDKKVLEKLKLVDLEDYVDYLPAEISGGMKKRASLARALALDPKLLFFDEPSSGLDPISSAGLDRLIIKLGREHNTTIVVVTHELDSIFSIADNSIMLDKENKSIIGRGSPEVLKKKCRENWVQRFLNRDGLTRKVK